MLSPAEVAQQLGLSRSTVYRAIEQGELPAFKVRGQLRVSEGDVEVYKENCRVRPRTVADPPMFEPSGGGSFLRELEARRA